MTVVTFLAFKCLSKPFEPKCSQRTNPITQLTRQPDLPLAASISLNVYTCLFVNYAVMNASEGKPQHQRQPQSHQRYVITTCFPLKKQLTLGFKRWTVLCCSANIEPQKVKSSLLNSRTISSTL